MAGFHSLYNMMMGWWSSPSTPNSETYEGCITVTPLYTGKVCCHPAYTFTLNTLPLYVGKVGE